MESPLPTIKNGGKKGAFWWRQKRLKKAFKNVPI